MDPFPHPPAERADGTTGISANPVRQKGSTNVKSMIQICFKGRGTYNVVIRFQRISPTASTRRAPRVNAVVTCHKRPINRHRIYCGFFKESCGRQKKATGPSLARCPRGYVSFLRLRLHGQKCNDQFASANTRGLQ